MTRVDPVPGAPDAARPLLVVHVPRTGGSTLKFMLRTTFGQQRTLLDAHWFRTESADLSGFAVVEGHLGAEFFTRTFGPDWVANGFTLLREPVARTVSQARHLRARPGPLQHHLAETVRDPGTVFEQIPMLRNLQTKQLSRTPLDAPVVSLDALERAKATLDQLAFGVTEAFDTSIALLMERLAIGIPKFDVANVSRGAHDDDLLSEEFRAAARAANDVDQQLHEYAAALFRTRITTFTESLLGLDLEESTLTCGLRYRGLPVEGAIRLHGARSRRACRVGCSSTAAPPTRRSCGSAPGWSRSSPESSVTTRPPDARPPQPERRRGRDGHDPARRPVDRAGRVRPCPQPAAPAQVIEVTRIEPEPLVARSVTAAKARINKLRRR